MKLNRELIDIRTNIVNECFKLGLKTQKEE